MALKNKKQLSILFITTLVIIMGLIIIALYLGKKQKNNNESPAANSTTARPSTKDTASNKKTNITQPTLTKSSGNLGPVPTGIPMNFICNSDLNVNCSIILESSNEKIVLGPIKIASNGRGDQFASFYWTSKIGKYKIYAHAENDNHDISNSLEQSLEVQ